MKLNYYYNKLLNSLFPQKKYHQDYSKYAYTPNHFINFWEGFEDNSFRLSEFIKTKNLNPEGKTVDFFSVFGPRASLKYSSNTKIFFTGEHIGKERYAAYNDYCLHEVDLAIGFRDIAAQNYIRFPLWLYALISPYHTSLEEIQSTLQDIEAKKQLSLSEKKFCCLIARHDMNGMRTHIYHQLETIAAIDCPSALLHNIDIQLSHRIEDKLEFLQNYAFTICPENTLSEGYVTEKLTDAFKGGCIPIYQGLLNTFDKSIINEKRIIFWNEDSPQLIAQLYTDPSKYQDFIREPLFLPHAAEIIFDHLQMLEKKLKSPFIS